MADATTSPPTCALSPKTVFMIGVGCAPRPASACRRANAWKRSAPSPPWWTRIAIDIGLDALCAWRGLPGKDETLLRAGLSKRSD